MSDFTHNHDQPSDFFVAIPNVPESFIKSFGKPQLVGPCDNNTGDVTPVLPGYRIDMKDRSSQLVINCGENGTIYCLHQVVHIKNGPEDPEIYPAERKNESEKPFFQIGYMQWENGETSLSIVISYPLDDMLPDGSKFKNLRKVLFQWEATKRSDSSLSVSYRLNLVENNKNGLLYFEQGENALGLDQTNPSSTLMNLLTSDNLYIDIAENGNIVDFKFEAFDRIIGYPDSEDYSEARVTLQGQFRPEVLVGIFSALSNGEHRPFFRISLQPKFDLY